ncbi:MAG: DUF1961 family protein [Carboxylicivirga sp.]|jgi:hypothetical protein|nr:DUF1961 family protein [Carboxylicivirga sp.]
MKNMLLIITAILLLSCQFVRVEESLKKTTLLFEDSCTVDWNSKWMLDGKLSKVINSQDGMELIAGPVHGNDTSHTVLWTKQSFAGNICIEYDYTRTDTTTRCVNILYFHATGQGDDDYTEDIALWNDKRQVPHMRTYFNHMNAYHISYAAFDAYKYSGDNDYISARRYDPAKKGLKGTVMQEKRFKTGMFKTGVTYHIEVYRFDDTIEMHIENKADKMDRKVYAWDASVFPSCEYGRIGLRHMYTRNARYKDFKVWKIK